MPTWDISQTNYFLFMVVFLCVEFTLVRTLPVVRVVTVVTVVREMDRRGERKEETVEIAITNMSCPQEWA